MALLRGRKLRNKFLEDEERSPPSSSFLEDKQRSYTTNFLS
ncbi:MAG: hypothetical protein ACYTX0_42175 [Nostoc sp.]